MKEKVISLLIQTGLTRIEIESKIEVPKDINLGDFAFPCFALSAKLKKSPVDIARELAEDFSSDISFDKIQAVGPYLNFFVKKETLVKEILLKIKTQKDKFGSSDLGKGKNIVIDYSGPNIGKPMHIGHIRSTLIGDSVSKISEFLGYNPLGINYLGDIGLHIGKLIVAYGLWVDKKALEEDPTKELLRLYVRFCEQEKIEVQEGQDDNFEGNEWTEKAKEKLLLIEQGDKSTLKIWKEIEKSSQEGFDRVYKLLGIKFKETTGQSNFSAAGKQLVLDALDKGVAKKVPDSEAVLVEFENLPKKFILRGNGTASYITQDLGAAVSRFDKYKFDEMIYVTDYRQMLHFQQLFEILNKLGYSFVKNCKHLPFGTVNFENEILATRAGKIVLLEEVLNKATEHAKEEAKKRNSKGDPQKIAFCAIKYGILKVEPSKDVSFSWKSALNFEGDTGPYILYSYARANSILSKSKKEGDLKKIPADLSIQEKSLIALLGKFPETVVKAHLALSPNQIANYAYFLAQSFNEFYHISKVVGTPDEKFKLVLVESTMQVLKNALSLLGIQVISKM
ncbi:MAG: arginine--tRNA ligase [Nanoarchaeota archaeon]